MVAIGLAANIFQFIDVGSRFVSNVRNISKSGRQGSSEWLDVQRMTEDMKNVLSGLRIPNESSPILDSNESGLKQLVGNCEGLAGELLDSLLKIHPMEKSRKRDNLRAALRMVWKEKELKSLQLRLDGYRQELVLHILTLIRYAQSSIN